MITYKSTRGDTKKYTFSEAILTGMAPDGGLFVPEKIPTISLKELNKLQTASYQQVAKFIFESFQTDIGSDVLEKIISEAYGTEFTDSKIAPVVHLKENQYLLELWHGPTSAFKDMALQIMPLLFSYAAKKYDSAKKYLILVATSGDTGKAALEGYKNKENISIMIFYPDKGVSQIQELQMQTQIGENVAIFAMKGDFDDCQRSVKETFADRKFAKELLEKNNTILSSANSINWGRVLPQIIYYFSAYLQLVNANKVKLGAPIDIVVPSGNFGNSLAGFYAKKMGLPVRNIICASNENNALTTFLQTGEYDFRNKTIIKTSSPSIDILVANNIERLLFLLTNDPKKVSSWMQELQNKKYFRIDNKTKKLLQETFVGDFVLNNDCLKNIKKIFAETGYVMDPHTSIAQIVGDKHKTTVPLVILSTAHFAKFVSDVAFALTGKRGDQNEFTLLSQIQKIAKNVSIPNHISDLQKKKMLHKKLSKKGREAIEEIILSKI